MIIPRLINLLWSFCAETALNCLIKAPHTDGLHDRAQSSFVENFLHRTSNKELFRCVA